MVKKGAISDIKSVREEEASGSGTTKTGKLAKKKKQIKKVREDNPLNQLKNMLGEAYGVLSKIDYIDNDAKNLVFSDIHYLVDNSEISKDDLIKIIKNNEDDLANGDTFGLPIWDSSLKELRDSLVGEDFDKNYIKCRTCGEMKATQKAISTSAVDEGLTMKTYCEACNLVS